MVKINKKGLAIAMVSVLSLTLTGCKTETNTMKTNDLKISSEEVYNDVLKTDPNAILEASLKASDVKILDKKYGSNNIDESKLLTQKKANSGSLYLEVIGQESGIKVTNDDEAKKALRYMEQQKMALTDTANDLVTDDEAKQYVNLKESYSVKHVLVKTAEEAQKMKTLIAEGKENIDTLIANSQTAKNSGQKESKSATGIAVIEAADYKDIKRGQFVAEFEKAALTTSPMNAWSEPVQTTYGFHLQYVYSRSGGYKEGDNLTQAKKDLVNELFFKNKSESSVAKMTMIKVRENNQVSFEDETLKNTYETYKTNTTKTYTEEKQANLSGKSQAESQTGSSAI